jgi:hypothetical protein
MVGCGGSVAAALVGPTEVWGGLLIISGFHGAGCTLEVFDLGFVHVGNDYRPG